MYDLIIQNNASKEYFVYRQLEDVAKTELYIQFDNILLDVPEGEYTYATFINNREDVTYTIKTPILDSIITTNDGDITLRDLNPYTGLMRVGTPKSDAVYDDDNNTTYYYEG